MDGFINPHPPPARNVPFLKSIKTMIDLHQGNAAPTIAPTIARLLEAGHRWHYCLSSPPYYGLCDYGHPEQLGHEPSSDEYLENIAHVYNLIRLGMPDNGVMWLNIGDTRSNYSTVKPRGRRGEASYRRKPEAQEKTLMNIPHRLVEQLKESGWAHMHTYIWVRGASSQPQDGRAIDTHEFIFVLSPSLRRRPQPAYTPLNSSVIEAHPDPTDFPCKMPLKLAEVMLCQATRDRATVIDPFIGSGTTAIAAARRGFDCIGIDLDISHAAKATQLIQTKLSI